MAADEHRDDEKYQAVYGDAEDQVVTESGRVSTREAEENQRAPQRIDDGEQSGNHNGDRATELSEDMQCLVFPQKNNSQALSKKSLVQ